jgi:hypothetical protein
MSVAVHGGGLLAVELGGVAGGGDEGGGGHADGGDGAAEVEEQELVTEEVRPGAAQEGEITGNEQEADFGRAEEALGELEAVQGVGGEEAFGGEQQESEQHGDGDGGVDEAGAGEAGHQGDRTEDVGQVVDVEAEARALLVANAGEGSVE